MEQISYQIHTDYNARADVPLTGESLLLGRIPDVRDAAGRPLMPYWQYDIALVTQDAVYQHVDLGGEYPITVACDMGEAHDIDRILIGGAYSRSADFCMGEYELYCAPDAATLFAPEHCAARYNGSGVWRSDVPGRGSIQLFTFDAPLRGRYLGMKVLRPNPTDAILRLARIEAFSRARDETKAFTRTFGRNALAYARLADAVLELPDGTTRRVWPEYGEWGALTDGICGDPRRMLSFATGGAPLRLTFRTDGAISPAAVSAVLSSDGQPTLSFAIAERESGLASAAPAAASLPRPCPYPGETLLRAETPDAGRGQICCIRLCGGDRIVLDQLVVTSDCLEVCADRGSVVNDDYLGNGANVIPFNLMPGNLALGYSEAHWLRDVRNMAAIRPALVRMWAQIDWMEREKGVYDFETQEMRALYAYAAALKEIGTEIQLTFSWKVGPRAQSWYSIPGVQAVNSAPRDVEAYAASCSALLTHLWSLGYDNVRHLAIANEPGGGGDFLCTGDAKAYFVKTFRALDRRLRADGIRDRVRLWAPEGSEDITYLELCAEELADCVDVYSQHWYAPTPEEVGRTVEYLKTIGAMPLAVTECTERIGGAAAWGRSLAGYTVCAANAGGSGIVMWAMHGVKSMSDYRSDSWAFAGDQLLWDPQLDGGAYHDLFYDFGLLCRYIPPHSRVIRAETRAHELRVAVWETPEGELTVAAEGKPSDAKRSLRVTFENLVGKTFYKHAYIPAHGMTEESGILPPVCAEIPCGTELYDPDFSTEYNVTVYTTLPPAAQVRITPASASMRAGESLSFTADIIDGTPGAIWSVAAGAGTVTPEGVFTLPSDTVPGSVTALRAQNADGAYNICLIRTR